ncbi:seven-hairpin glycosidase [Corynespora cassiicola Philippines]|uniref:alpha-1,2-Mannosidase n=1 Tax=Corynespora cassiicola Philippines TaxID=1448308 RepID=A0A2T2N0Y3_CORCC|nr:seven-hairpin glycosidase [Corynespora cassiicola Philippines]
MGERVGAEVLYPCTAHQLQYYINTAGVIKSPHPLVCALSKSSSLDSSGASTDRILKNGAAPISSEEAGFGGQTHWYARRQEVKEAFVASWNAYSKYAWGNGRFHPVSKAGSQMSPKGLGWIIVDSLDTLMIMNLTEQLIDCRKWLHRNLDYDQDQDINTFETTIRILGGLLSAHYLSSTVPGASSRRDRVYLDKAIDLADRLLGVYDTRTGIPYASLHLANRKGIRSHADEGSSSTAEATTLQLEMKYLSNITGNEIYWRKAEKVMEAIESAGAVGGPVPIFVDPHSGRYTSREVRLGSRGDSYYELPRGLGGQLSPKMDHLACFLPGVIALDITGGLTKAEYKQLHNWTREQTQQMRLARELTKTCWSMYKVTATGLAPEIVWFRTSENQLQPRMHKSPHVGSSSNPRSLWMKDVEVRPLDAHNLQRPETVESLFVMWRWGWEIFKAFQQYTTIPLGEGHSSLDNVNAVPPPRTDNMESFWLTETLKYLYLRFSPDDVLPLCEVVFNTEAHVFPRIELGKFATGWKRKHSRKLN